MKSHGTPKNRTASPGYKDVTLNKNREHNQAQPRTGATMRKTTNFQISTLSAAIASTLISGYATAQQSALEEVIVTATRRAQSVQDIPINITALGANLIERERITDLSDIAKRVPGMNLVDQGPRSGNILAVRGLSADSITAVVPSNTKVVSGLKNKRASLVHGKWVWAPFTNSARG